VLAQKERFIQARSSAQHEQEQQLVASVFRAVIARPDGSHLAKIAAKFGVKL
jgi:hypothetical protein